MNLTVSAGRYVVAVSGGVDSMVLLDLLCRLPGLSLTVAHLDHGIRAESVKDRQLVQTRAQELGLPFVYHRLELGEKASEAKARQARYDFLHKVRRATAAQALITAHHQDDQLETAIINILRGTGRKGLSALKSQDLVLRPLLGYSKSDILSYARKNSLVWHEDSTNLDSKYLRNHVRLNMMTRFSDEQRQLLLQQVEVAGRINQELDSLLAVQLHIQPSINRLDRHWFIGLPHNVAREVMASWLRNHGVNFDKKTLERLVVAAKTYSSGKQADLNRTLFLEVTNDHLALLARDR